MWTGSTCIRRDFLDAVNSWIQLVIGKYLTTPGCGVSHSFNAALFTVIERNDCVTLFQLVSSAREGHENCLKKFDYLFWAGTEASSEFGRFTEKLYFGVMLKTACEF